MAIDPNAPHNFDLHQRPLDNCGFVIAQNLPRTHEILQCWASCPDNDEFVNCSDWKNKWPAEQAAFGNYIRYKFAKSGDLNEIPCDEANGYPGSNSECSGTFIRHFWMQKDSTGDQVNHGVMNVLMHRVMQQFKDNLKSLVMQRKTNKFEKSSQG